MHRTPVSFWFRCTQNREKRTAGRNAQVSEEPSQPRSPAEADSGFVAAADVIVGVATVLERLAIGIVLDERLEPRHQVGLEVAR
jgi:hypothetical protein